MREGRSATHGGHRRDRRRLTSRAADGTRRGARGRQRHGLTAVKRVIAALGSRTIDQAIDARTSLGRALAAWRRDLTADLGGAEHVSTQQAAVIELAVRTRLMLDSVDAFILTMPSLVNKRRRVLFPVVLQRQSLARDLAHFLGLLGLARRPPKPVDLSRYLAERYASGAPAEAEGQ
jgi:hypothetical protein